MQKVITHSGSFHADDVFAVAALQLHFGVENIEVIRTRDEEVVATGDIVVDVGGVFDPTQGRFDHHQNGSPIRDNGIPYAAFGLIWEEYGEKVAGSKEAADIIEKQLVVPVDANDVGVHLYELKNKEIGPATIQDIVSLWRPVWDSDGDKDLGFSEACDLARDILSRAVNHAKADIEQSNYAKSAYESADDKKIIVLDKSASTHFFIEYPEVVAVVYPSEEGDRWSAAMVRKNYDSYEPRAKFPDEWTGKRSKELAEASGVHDALFCHKAGFLFVAKSKEGVLEAVQKTLET